VTRHDMIAQAQHVSAQWEERAAEHDARGLFPADDMNDLREAGLLGLMVPEQLGGMGARFEDYVQVAMTLARASGASALLFNMHASVTGALAGVDDELARAMGAPQSFFTTRDVVLRRAASGAMFGVAISERDAGSRLSAIASSYARDGERYHLRGHKSACSGAGHLDAYLVAARAADAGDDEDARVSYFLVPGDQVTDVDDTWDTLGMRATASNGFVLDAVVDADALLGGVEGLALLLAYTMPQWLVASYAAVYVGVAEAVVAAAVEHVRDRNVRGPAVAGASTAVGLAASPTVRGRLGRADAQAAAARLALEHAARLVDASPGEPETNRSVYRAKLLAGDAAFEVAASCTEACGLGGLSRRGPLERLLRDARSGAVMPPSSDVAADVLGAVALGVEPGSGQGPRPW
jgi:alkylation response protein AidB-like acyl-CoA dehydrogenase